MTEYGTLSPIDALRKYDVKRTEFARHFHWLGRMRITPPFHYDGVRNKHTPNATIIVPSLVFHTNEA
eukprot:5915212-Prorocentrum_lima.AAC.1